LATSLAGILAAAIQDLVEDEVTAQIGTAHGERTPTRVTQRNGHRPNRTDLHHTPGRNRRHAVGAASGCLCGR
jgi:transposase-like protein